MRGFGIKNSLLTPAKMKISVVGKEYPGKLFMFMDSPKKMQKEKINLLLGSSNDACKWEVICNLT